MLKELKVLLKNGFAALKYSTEGAVPSPTLEPQQFASGNDPKPKLEFQNSQPTNKRRNAGTRKAA